MTGETKYQQLINSFNEVINHNEELYNMLMKDLKELSSEQACEVLTELINKLSKYNNVEMTEI